MALFFYAICAGLLQVLNVDEETAICISENVSGLSGIIAYVGTALWMLRGERTVFLS